MDNLAVMAQEVRRYKSYYDVDVEEVVNYKMEEKVEIIFRSGKLQWKHVESGSGGIFLYPRKNIV